MPWLKYRKKPVVIEAHLWTGDLVTMARFVPRDLWILQTGMQLCLSTLEGVMVVDLGDYIIRGVKGEYYPCKPDIFALTYDKVESDADE